MNSSTSNLDDYCKKNYGAKIHPSSLVLLREGTSSFLTGPSCLALLVVGEGVGKVTLSGGGVGSFLEGREGFLAGGSCTNPYPPL